MKHTEAIFQLAIKLHLDLATLNHKIDRIRMLGFAEQT